MKILQYVNMYLKHLCRRPFNILLVFNFACLIKKIMLLLSSADFFSKLTFSKNSFRNTIGVSNDLDPDQD